MSKNYSDMNDFEKRVHSNPTVWIVGNNERAVSRGEQMKRQGEGKKFIYNRFEPFEKGFPTVMTRETYDMVDGGFAPKHDLFKMFTLLFMLDNSFPKHNISNKK